MEKGIDDIYCMCVNDAFVMNAWGKELGIEKVKMVPDGDGKFTEGMDMLVHKPAQGFALIHNNRIVCFYSYESDIGDGWEDASVHKDPQYIREKALKMGANILGYIMNPK